MTASFPAIHFFYDSVIISRDHLKHPYVKDTVLILQHLLQSSIIPSGLWLFLEKLKGRYISMIWAWTCNPRKTISFSVSKISFIYLMTPIDSTNDQNTMHLALHLHVNDQTTH